MFAKRFIFNLIDCCSSVCTVTIDLNSCLTNVTFNGGCPGYSRNLSADLEDCSIDEAIAICNQNKCGDVQKDCSIKLCHALKEKLIWLKENKD